MKQYILVPLVLLRLAAMAQAVMPRQVVYEGQLYWQYESVNQYNNMPFKLWYMYDSAGVYLGWVEEFPRDGKWINFFEEDSAQVASIFEVKDSLLEGISIQFDLDGHKSNAYSFSQGMQSGPLRYWNSAGLLTLEETYIIKDYGHFKSGVLNGAARSWYNSGNLRRLSQYTEGERDGVEMTWYSDGTPRSEAFFDDMEKDSTLTFFYRNGAVQSQLKYRQGVFVAENPADEFHANGKIAGTGNYEDGRKTGQWTYYYDNGVRESEGGYGTYIYHHEHGDFPMQIKIGLWEYWYPSGQRSASGNYDSTDIVQNNLEVANAGKKDNWVYFSPAGDTITLEAWEHPIDLMEEMIWEEMDWDRSYLQELTAEERSFIGQNLQFGCEYHALDDRLDHFRKIDLNEDGRMDLIFKDGCPYPEVSIFLQTPNGYEKVVSNQLGVITSIHFGKSATVVRIGMDAVGVLSNNSVCEVKFSAGAPGGVRKHWLFWHYDFELPEEDLSGPIDIRVLASPKTLRTQPVVNNHRIRNIGSESPRFYHGNKIGVLQKGAAFRVTAIKKTKKGRKWALVEVISTELFQPDKKSLQEYFPGETIVIGWMRIE